MKQYLDLLQNILDNGEVRGDRTGVGTISLFGCQLRFDLSEGFPAVTTKKLAFKGVKSEILWFLEGDPDERRLAEIHYGQPRCDLVGKTTIWTANADNQGKALGYHNTDTFKPLGPVYGVQWRHWFDGQEKWIDQIGDLIKGIKTNPNGRRHILNAWNVGAIDSMALPPCHVMCQFYVSTTGKLSCHMYQRSVDVFLGLPFNIASYALLTHMIAQVCDLDVGELIISTGDTHVYSNHVEQVKEQLARNPYPLPKLEINPNVKSIDDFTMDDIQLVDYQSHPTIKADMAV